MPRRFLFRMLASVTPVGDDVPDAELLRRFAREGDSAAFELVVRRHADAVWTACRRLLRCDADAEDAFQATFLVLARKAGEVRRSCAGGWLHRVAVNAALRLRASGRRQPAVSGPTEQPADAGRSPPDAAEQLELAAVVHEELARLPERYRLPVVLCDLEGHTHTEAARALRWPVGSVSGRLSRARALLRDRLTRRGFAPVGTVLVFPLTFPSKAVSAAVAAGAGVVPVSPDVSALTHGVLAAMRTAKLKLVATVVASAGLIGLAGVGTAIAWPRSGPPTAIVRPPAPVAAVVAPAPAEQPIEGDWLPKDGTSIVPSAYPNIKPTVPGDPSKSCPLVFGTTPLTIEPTDDTYRRLLKARLHQGQTEVNLFQSRVNRGAFSHTDYIEHWSCLHDMRETAAELWVGDPKTLIPWMEEFVLLAKERERFMSARRQAGVDGPQTLNAAQRNRLQVETELWKVTHPAVKR